MVKSAEVQGEGETENKDEQDNIPADEPAEPAEVSAPEDK
jgi:hypothetical protein